MESHKFDNLQQLLDYCYLCPFCDRKRNVDITIGPDIYVQHGVFIGDLTASPSIAFVLNYLGKRILRINLTPLTNDFTFDGSMSAITDQNIREMNEAGVFFHFYARCMNDRCGKSSINTEDINIDLINRGLSNFAIEDEWRSVHILDRIFFLGYQYPAERIVVEKYDNINYRSEVRFTIPLTNFDFTDTKRLGDKLNTLAYYA